MHFAFYFSEKISDYKKIAEFNSMESSLNSPVVG